MATSIQRLGAGLRYGESLIRLMARLCGTDASMSGVIAEQVAYRRNAGQDRFSMTPTTRRRTMDPRYSPYDFDTQNDPYPVYARLRAESPVYRNESDDFWAVSRH